MAPEPETTAEAKAEPSPEAELLTTREMFGLYAGFIALLFIFCVILLVLYLKQRKRLRNLSQDISSINGNKVSPKSGIA